MIVGIIIGVIVLILILPILPVPVCVEASSLRGTLDPVKINCPNASL